MNWAQVPAAIAHLKKAVVENWRVRSLTAVFVKAVKYGVPEQLTSHEEEKPFSGMPQEVNPPTIEQMVQLQSALDRGEIHDIHLSSDGVTKVIKLDRLTQVSWREYLEVLE